jgi:hypothetical protein
MLLNVCVPDKNVNHIVECSSAARPGLDFRAALRNARSRRLLPQPSVSSEPGPARDLDFANDQDQLA